MPHYIMYQRNDAYWLVGPFASIEALSAFGADPVNNPLDDPRWQSIELDCPRAVPLVISCDQHQKMIRADLSPQSPVAAIQNAE